jgi:hypothetical protein
MGIDKQCDGLYWWHEKKKLIFVAGGRIAAFSNLDDIPEEVSRDDLRLEVGTPVSFATNGVWLFMANGGKIVVWNGRDPAQYLYFNGDVLTATHLGYIGGRILRNEVGTARVTYTQPYQTGEEQLPEWTNEFFEPEASPDSLEAMMTGWGEVLLFGPKSLEFFYNADDPDAPFQRIQGAYAEMGIGAKYSLVAANNTWYWLNSERRIVTLEGRTPKIISTPFDKVLTSFKEVKDCVGTLLDRFLLFSFLLSDFTLVHDLFNGGWYKWATWDTQMGLWQRYLGQLAVYASDWSMWFVGGRDTANLYIYHPNLMTDNGEAIRGLYRTAHIDWNAPERKYCRKLSLRLKRG